MGIYDALFRLGFTLWGERLAESLQGAHSWQDEVKLLMETYMRFALENPELYQLCFERPVPGFVPSEESLQISFGILNQSYEHVSDLLPHMDTDLEPEQVADLVIALSHGLTAQHMANEPQLPIGQGRFGALIPAALSVFDKAWSKT